MNATTTRQEIVAGGHGGGMPASGHVVGGGGSVWSQQPVVVEDRGTAVHSELMQKSSVTEQQSASTMSGRQDLNTGTAAPVLTTRTLSPTSNVGPSFAGRSDLPAHYHTECRVLLSFEYANFAGKS